MSRAVRIVVLWLIAAISVVVGLAAGSVSIPVSEVFSALVQPGSDAISDIVWKLRLPRVLAAFSCGALLALAGTLMQVLLRNPLADPYVFGISGGAALGVMLGMLLGVGTLRQTGLGLTGAALASVLVFGLSLRAGNWNPYRLLLTGVVVAAGLNALLSLILIHVVNRQSFHWSMELHLPWGLLALLAGTLLAFATLTALASGRRALGVDVVRAVREDW